MKSAQGSFLGLMPKAPQRLVWRQEAGRSGWRRGEERRVWIVASRATR